MNVEPTKMTHQNPVQPGERRAPQLPEEPNKCQQHDDVVHVETGISGLETCQYDFDETARVINNEGSSLEGTSSAPVVVDDVTKEAMRAKELLEEDNGRERLKRHRIEVAGRVWIPEVWSQEELLMDWIDCSVFEASLVPNGILSARAALVDEGRRANSGGFRIENRC
ncbi:protein BIC1-like [Durio zibethinus]|uniref:Protein BIC1-like n=1 Tax=Durio zibethinus TaxID=66656 RepID=A0A6P5YWS8_DURZI|nr:protein BIC1-like [Durio zibethinus]